jgi:hypothetical protein
MQRDGDAVGRDVDPLDQQLQDALAPQQDQQTFVAEATALSRELVQPAAELIIVGALLRVAQATACLRAPRVRGFWVLLQNADRMPMICSALNLLVRIVRLLRVTDSGSNRGHF